MYRFISSIRENKPVFGGITEFFMSVYFLSYMQCQMPSFRWPDVDNDISLAKEVISRRPNKPSDWESIACTLSQLFSTEEKPVALKGRGCRERMELLIKKYREEDNKSLKRYLRACLV